VDEMEEGKFKSFKHEHFFEYNIGIVTVLIIFVMKHYFGFLENYLTSSFKKAFDEF
jgi:hypothetical protein